LTELLIKLSGFQLKVTLSAPFFEKEPSTRGTGGSEGLFKHTRTKEPLKAVSFAFPNFSASTRPVEKTIGERGFKLPRVTTCSRRKTPNNGGMREKSLVIADQTSL
jgi:hypothetical protein